MTHQHPTQTFIIEGQLIGFGLEWPTTTLAVQQDALPALSQGWRWQVNRAELNPAISGWF
jgi:hypothetical protein